MSELGYIKIHRKLLNWQYIDVPQAVALWVYILLKANWTTGYFRGIKVERGTLITSYQKLANATGLSVQQTRTWLDNFQTTHQITRKTTNKYTVISVVNYDAYQVSDGNEQQAKQQANQQTNNKQITNKQQQYKNNKNNKNNKKSVGTHPSLDEVVAYCEERHSNINPTRFYNYYNQRNWLVGGNVIDWRLKVADWEQTEIKKQTERQVIKAPDYIQRQKQGIEVESKPASKELVERVKKMQRGRESGN